MDSLNGVNHNKIRIIKPTNSLILLIPDYYYKIPNLLNLLRIHFNKSYKTNLLSWTNLIGLSRILLIYEEIESAKQAKLEMDWFIWEEEEDDDNKANTTSTSTSPPEPLRVFYGPLLSLPLPSLEKTLLSVPALSKNFLISPPGSPPVGWEQTLEEAPNRRTFGDTEGEEGEGEGAGEGWGEELARALRFLSVSSGDDEDGDGGSLGMERIGRQEGIQEGIQEGVTSTTTIIPPALSNSSSSINTSRPSITLSTPPSSSNPSLPNLQGYEGTTSNLSNSGALAGTKITNVKATIESMLGRKKSLIFSPPPDVINSSSTSIREGLNGNGNGGGLGGGKRVIIPTARPPTLDQIIYQEN